MFYFDIKALVQDVGGPTRVAQIVGKVRTAVHGWVKRGNMSASDLAAIKAHNPDIDLNRYVKRKE